MRRFKLKLKLNPRKGNMLAIFLFALMIAIMSFGTLSIASSLYSSGESTAKRYANVQSYRAAAEMACYQYVNDLQAITVKKNLKDDWISVSGATVYTQACEAIQDEIGKEDNHLQWNVANIETAVAGAGVTDASIVTNLLGLLTSGRTQFTLTIVNYPEVDWSSVETAVSSKESLLKLLPIEVDVDLVAKGEAIKEKLFVSGLYLKVSQEKVSTESGRDTAVTMSIVQGEGGIQIYRE